MGKTIRLKCNDCGKSYDLNIGQGRADNSLDRVLGYFDQETADLIRAKLSILGADERWIYRKMIGYCSSCRSFKEIPTFNIVDDRKDFITAAKCQCNNSCELIDDTDASAMDAVTCPECGGSMSASVLSRWD